ncbi:hypothetical protein G6F22_008805 [Rhizopus arrhizus]|nr:hypothetical protein G6F22_008805 [Rhizopus arrhizus]
MVLKELKCVMMDLVLILSIMNRLHYTSKINEFEDLEKVMTFGFRGEALSSLCALSQLTVITATKEQAPMGVKLEYDENGLLVSKTPIARSIGTTVQLSNMFHSLPVRQKEFKRNCKKEYGKALSILQAYSIISTNTKISVFNQSKSKPSTRVMYTNKNKDITSNISNIFGAKILSQIIPFQINLDKGSVEGYISKPEWGLGRSSSDRQHFFVNGRPCILPKMAKALNEIYRSFISNQYPFIIADFKIPTDAYDVNVSPDKRTIFIHEESKIAETIMNQLRSLLEPSRSTFQTNSLIKTPSPIESQEGSKREKVSLQSFALASGSSYRPTTVNLGKRLHKAGQESTSSRSMHDYLCKKKPRLDEELDELTEEYETSVSEEQAIVTTVQKEFTETDVVNDVEQQEITVDSSIQEEPIIATHSNIQEEATITTEMNTIQEKDTADNVTQEIESKIEEDIHSDVEELTDEQQFIEQDKEMKSFEGHTKTNGCTMIINIKDLDTILLDIQSSANDNDTLTDKTDVFDFYAGVQNTEDNDKAVEALNRVIHKSDFERMRVLGQFNLGFMITSLDDQDLYIIDQHASDEKYNFETLQQTVKVNNQKLISPQIPDLTAAEELIVMDNIEVFKANGFDVEIITDNEPTKRLRVLSQPVTKKAMLDKKDFSELIYLLSEHPGEMVRCSRNRATFASMACHKAVRIGQSLTKSKMTKIVRHMGEIDQPWNCPHGRPTMRHLFSLSEFKKTVTTQKKRELTFGGTLFN